MNTINEEDKKKIEEYGLLEIELKNTKTLLASCESALNQREAEVERLRKENEVFKRYLTDFRQNALEAGTLSFPIEFFTALDNILNNETESVKAWANHMNETYGKSSKEWADERTRLHAHIKSNTDQITALCDEIATLKKQVEEKDKEISFLKFFIDDQRDSSMPAGNIFDGPK